MRVVLESWPNEVDRPVAIAGGTARVYFDYAAPRVVHGPSGTVSPARFTYVERPRDPKAPLYAVECEHDGEGLPRVRSVNVIRVGEGREVRSADLRKLRNLEDAIEAAWRAVSYSPNVTIADSEAEADRIFAERLAAEPARLRREIAGLRRRARRAVTPELLDEIARVYRENRASGAPTKAVQERFGIAPSTASLYVKRARDAGLDLGGER